MNAHLLHLVDQVVVVVSGKLQLALQVLILEGGAIIHQEPICEQEAKMVHRCPLLQRGQMVQLKASANLGETLFQVYWACRVKAITR